MNILLLLSFFKNSQSLLNNSRFSYSSSFLTILIFLLSQQTGYTLAQTLNRSRGLAYICLESTNLTTRQPFTISWPNGFFSSQTVQISLFQGNVFTSDQCSPSENGQTLSPLQTWTLNSGEYNIENGIAFRNLSINDESMNNAEGSRNNFFFQATTTDKRSCMVGPLENTQWTIQTSPRLVNGTNNTNPSDISPPQPSPDTIFPPNDDKPTSNNNPSNPAIIAASVAAIIAVLIFVSALLLVVKRRKSKEKNQEKQDLEKNNNHSEKLIDLSANAVNAIIVDEDPISNDIKSNTDTDPKNSIDEDHDNEDSKDLTKKRCTLRRSASITVSELPSSINTSSATTLKNQNTPTASNLSLSRQNSPTRSKTLATSLAATELLMNQKSSLNRISLSSANDKGSTSSGLLLDDAKLIADTFRKELGDMEWDKQSGTSQSPIRSFTKNSNGSDNSNGSRKNDIGLDKLG